MTSGLWVIGYGSLIYKPPPHTAFRLNGYLKGFIRRFWQSSSDHRGTPESPGRVVTLVSLEDLQENERFHSDMHAYELKLDSGEKLTVEDLSVEDLKVWGCAYYIPPEFADEVKRYLDVREQDGYTLHKVPFYATSNDYEGSDEQYLDILSSLAKTESGETYCESSIYIGTIDNESFIGPEELLDTAKVIKYSRGPSGENSEYLINLCKSVRELEGEGRSKDTYLEELLASVEGNGLK